MPISRELKNAAFMYLGILVALFLAVKLNHLGYSYDTSHEDGLPPRVEYKNVIGIHFGREYSRVGLVRGYTFTPIADAQGRTAIPNYVAFLKTKDNVGSPIVGFEAKEQAESNPHNTFYDFRRLLGRNGTHPDVQKAIQELPYTILDDFEPAIWVRVGVKHDYIGYKLEEFTGMILKELKVMAEMHLNDTVNDAVITIPSDFDKYQRDLMIEAARLAGLNVLRLVDEPTAIAMAYRLGTTYCDGEGEKVDCRYVLYEDDDRFSHLSLYHAGLDGNGVLGTIVDDRADNPRDSFWASLLEQFSLTKSEPATVDQQSKRILELVDRLLLTSNKERKDIDGLIIITPSQNQTSSVQEILQTHLPNSKLIKAYDDFTPDQALVCGASLLADLMLGPRIEPYFTDTTLLSLGIELKNGSFLRIIPRNYVTPLRKSVVLNVAASHDHIEPFRIYEGERELASKNHELGEIELGAGWFREGVQQKWMDEVERMGKVEIELAFAVDAREVLEVVVWKGGVSMLMFRRPVMGRRWRWRDVEDIVEEAVGKREEDMRVLSEGDIVGMGEIEFKGGAS